MLWLCCISVLLYTYIIYVTGDCNDYNATQEFIDLEASLAGEIIYPSDPTHSDLNNVENAYYDSIVTDSIIYVESEQDVVDTVKFFKKNKECAGDDSIPFRIRSGGHSYGMLYYLFIIMMFKIYYNTLRWLLNM